MDIIVNNGKICNNGEISTAVKVHAGVDEKQEINKYWPNSLLIFQFIWVRQLNIQYTLIV